MFVQRLDGDALAVSLWDGPPQDIAVTLAGGGDSRRISGLEIDWTRRGKAFLAVLDFPGACYPMFSVMIRKSLAGKGWILD
jgi:hypothetical protein